MPNRKQPPNRNTRSRTTGSHRTELERSRRRYESDPHYRNHPVSNESRNPRRKQKLSRAAEPLISQKKWLENWRSMTFVAFISIAFAMVYLFQSVYFFWTSPNISTEIIRFDNVDAQSTVKGIIIRDEQVYFAPQDGQAVFNVNDYDRVKPGIRIGSIQNSEVVKDINDSIVSIENQIMELQLNWRGIDTVDPAVLRMNSQLKQIIDGRMHHFTTQSVQEVYNLKDNINQMLNTRNQILLNDNKDIRNELGQAQQDLNNRLDRYTTPIYIEQGGIMSPIIDGFEEVYTLENMKDLSRVDTTFSVDYNTIITTRDVKEGEPVFKIIASNVWYIAAYFPNNIIEGFEKNQVRTFYIETEEGFIPFLMQIEELDANFQDSFLLLKCNKNMIDFLNTRSVNVRTAQNMRTGFKISNSAIVMRNLYAIPHDYLFESDRSEYVLRDIDETQLITPVVVSMSDNRYYYIPVETDGLRQGDSLIHSVLPEERFTLSDFETIQGVYRANRGYAEFRRIIMDDNAHSGTFVILDPTLNLMLREADQIITNGADVKDGQIIY